MLGRLPFVHSGEVIYRKVCSGEPIDDNEFQQGLQRFGLLYQSLAVLGERFHFAAAACRRVYIRWMAFVPLVRLASRR